MSTSLCGDDRRCHPGEVLVLAIRAERAFDGEQAIPGGALILTDDGRIVGIEPASAPLPEGWPVVEASGATLLPGLIDGHVHLCGTARMAPWSGCPATATPSWTE
jgi:imidazolonepropionase-like amidohydrolase